MDTETIQKKLAKVVKDLELIARLVAETSANVPTSAQQLVAEERCLNCKEPYSAKKGRIVRGCHESCYRETMRAIDAGELTENEVISAGLLLPKSSGGRPTKETGLKELLRKKQEELAQADVDALIAKEKAKKSKK